MYLKIYPLNSVVLHEYKEFVTKLRKEIETKMGLAASQARLLTITARKSDCEFQSMRYSHEKIALSRSMTDLSNEYQNSLEQTKLVYDYYGTGDETTPLSYGLLMTPSQLNGYLPTLITDASGKAVLSSQYAAAAKVAGIPQEGLGCLPSSDVRNKFIQAMADNGLITQQSADTYMGIQYAQSMGMGTTDLVTTEVKEMTLSELLEYYSSGEYGGETLYQYNKGALKSALQNGRLNEVQIRNGAETSNLADTNLSLADIISGDYQILCKLNYEEKDDRWSHIGSLATNLGNLDIWDWMFSEFESLLSVSSDPNVAAAIQYAETQTSKLLDKEQGYAFQLKGEKTKEKSGWEGVINCMNAASSQKDGHTWSGALFQHRDDGKYATSDYLGITCYYNDKPAKRNRADGVSIDVSNIAKAYLTYFAQAMEGLSTSEYKVSDVVNNRTVADSHLIDDQFVFNIVTETGVNTDQALISGFYDSIFNQICTRGWVENNNVTDNDYMQEMLKTGKFFLATCADDGYYYQGNYSTNTYIREITDEEAIAKAEAKYNTEKQKLNQKEEVLDLKMKNLDTEISSLTTEYDTIKSVISKNIEKSFKRYDA